MLCYVKADLCEGRVARRQPRVPGQNNDNDDDDDNDNID